MHRNVHPAPRGQVIVIAALAMVSLIGGIALVLEAGNAYANQREAQNGPMPWPMLARRSCRSDSAGLTKTDLDRSPHR